MSDPGISERRAESESLGDLLGEVAEDLSTLMPQELALAKAELRESGKNLAQGVGVLTGAAYAGAVSGLFFSVALWWLLARSMGGGWAGLIVAALWALAALAMGLVGRAALKKVNGAPQTMETLPKVLSTLKRNGESNV